jgi:hypothetical protein
VEVRVDKCTCGCGWWVGWLGRKWVPSGGVTARVRVEECRCGWWLGGWLGRKCGFFIVEVWLRECVYGW